jgi:natural product biosynthesis luciferase-like monooxygenase protein
MRFSLFYFSTDESVNRDDRYGFLLEGARFADCHDFEAIWTPERHFHRFGGVFPNPSVLSAALAVATNRVALRAGSLVLPLHDPLRVAEEWSVVDNLSRGRVGVAVATGYNPHDFVLAPQNFVGRNEVALSKLGVLRRLWRGESIELPDGKGRRTATRISPTPLQPDLPVWITCGGADAGKFAQAGALGANVLTALFVMNVDELAGRIAEYRAARAAGGLDPATGRVTLMVHTFVGDSVDSVRAVVREPMIEYLRSSVEVWSAGHARLDALPERKRGALLSLAFERYFRNNGLFGSPLSCCERVEKLAAAGVDEVACLMDFGVPRELLGPSLLRLDELRRLTAKVRPKPAADTVMAASPATGLESEAAQPP